MIVIGHSRLGSGLPGALLVIYTYGLPSAI
jgi:hypothetical protein